MQLLDTLEVNLLEEKTTQKNMDANGVLFQFLVPLNKCEQDREPLSALSLECLCPADLTACSS